MLSTYRSVIGFSALILLALAALAPQQAQAQINCTIGSQSNRTETYVLFNPADNSCKLIDNNTGLNTLQFRQANVDVPYGVAFAFETRFNSAGDLLVYADIDGVTGTVLNGATASNVMGLNEHRGIENWPAANGTGTPNNLRSVAAGFQQGSTIQLGNGQYTSTIRFQYNADGDQARMVVTYTVTNGGVNKFELTVNSAQVLDIPITSSSTSATQQQRQQQLANVVQNAGQSQTVVTTQNVSARISNIGSPVGVSRGTPSGVGRDTPGGVGRDTPGGVGRSTPGGGGGIGAPSGGGASGANTGTGADDGTANFYGYQSNAQLLQNPWGGQNASRDTAQSSEDFFRQLAMAATFDSSQMDLASLFLGQAEGTNAGTQIDQTLARNNLLAGRPWTIWGHGSFTDVENRQNLPNDDSRYGGDVWGYNMGLDYQFNPELYAGISLGYADTSLDTHYNSGKYSERNYSITPYLVYRPTDAFKVSVLAGYSIGELDLNRDDGAVTSDTDSSMYFAATNASYTFRFNEDVPWDIKT